MKVNHDTWLALVFLLFCAFAGWQTSHLPAGVGGSATMGPAFFPGFMIWVVTILAVALLVRSLVRGVKGSSIVLVRQSAIKNLCAFLVLLAVYAAIYEKLGFLLSSALVMVAGMLILGERRPLALFFWPACLVGAAWLAFTQVMQVQLPTFGM